MSLQDKVIILYCCNCVQVSKLSQDTSPSYLSATSYSGGQSVKVFQPDLDTDAEKELDGVEDEGFQEGPEIGGTDLDSFCAPKALVTR